jgi:hypothetical protein
VKTEIDGEAWLMTYLKWNISGGEGRRRYQLQRLCSIESYERVITYDKLLETGKEGSQPSG